MDPLGRLRVARSAADALDLSPRPASESRTVIVEVMEIQDVNNAGDVHGGTIMRLADTAAGIAAMRHARRRVVTASMDEMQFLAPVQIGDIVTVQATVNEAWRTSMEVGVRVDVERLPSGQRVHVASAYLVFVAIGEDMRPIPVPVLTTHSDAERRRQAAARIRREQRLLRKEALRGLTGGESGRGSAGSAR